MITFSPARTKVMLALLRVYERDGRATLKSIGAEAGLRSVDLLTHYLRPLREAGLVAWEDRLCGTLRPLVRLEALTAQGDGSSGFQDPQRQADADQYHRPGSEDRVPDRGSDKAQER